MTETSLFGRHLSSPISTAPILFLDIETTGLHPDRGASITEIAILGNSGEQFAWAADQRTSDLPLGELRIVVGMISSAIVVGHNVMFDLRFIAYSAGRAGIAGPDLLYADTMELSRLLVHDLPDYRLATVLEHFQIRVQGKAHTAMVDASATRFLFWRLVELGGFESLGQIGLKRTRWDSR